jgi:hypothetical protein
VIIETLSVAECPFCDDLVTNKGKVLPEAFAELFELGNDRSTLMPLGAAMHRHFSKECRYAPLLVVFAGDFCADMFNHIQTLKATDPIKANALAHNLGFMRDSITGDSATNEHSRTNPDGYKITDFKMVMDDEGDMKLIDDNEQQKYLPFKRESDLDFIVSEPPTIRSHRLWPDMAIDNVVTHLDILDWMRA